jgi:hypothetical protein
MAGKFEYGMRNALNDAYAEGRARAFGVGPANPHAVSSLKHAAFEAGLAFTGSSDSTPYGAAGWSNTWTGVTFDGTADVLENPTNLGLSATSDTFTLAMAFRLNEAKSHTLVNAVVSGGVFGVTVSSTGVMSINFFNGVWGFGSAGVAFTFAAGVDYVLHIAGTASTNTLRCWVNGAEQVVTVGFWFGTGAFGRPASWSIGGPAATPSLSALVGLFWFDFGQYIVDPTKFAPAYDLGAQLANPGARPAIGFGGVQTVANWNAGTNLGDGTGTWTMTGAVT